MPKHTDCSPQKGRKPIIVKKNETSNQKSNVQSKNKTKEFKRKEVTTKPEKVDSDPDIVTELSPQEKIWFELKNLHHKAGCERSQISDLEWRKHCAVYPPKVQIATFTVNIKGGMSLRENYKITNCSNHHTVESLQEKMVSLTNIKKWLLRLITRQYIVNGSQDIYEVICKYLTPFNPKVHSLTFCNGEPINLNLKLSKAIILNRSLPNLLASRDELERNCRTFYVQRWWQILKNGY